jgi:hypothetical protein
MRRPLVIVVAALVGVLVGAAGMAALDDSTTLEASLARGEAPVAPAPVPEPRDRTLLVWTADALPADLAARVAALPDVRSSTLVEGDTLSLVASYASDGQPIDRTPPGEVIPLDALAIDPATYAPFWDKAAQAQLLALRPGEALLGTTSARLRRAGPGTVLELAGGARVTVAGVIADQAVGAAEVVVDAATAPAIGITTPRFLLVAYQGDRTPLEQQITPLLPPRTSVRYRSRGETPFLRHADAVLPQALIKDRFGEFSYTPPTSDRFFTVDAAWRDENIETRTVPALGKVMCHRAVLPALEGALAELEQRNLLFLVDRAGYQGCFQPSVVSENGSISRHSWGVAADINFSKNPTGAASAVDPRLVEVMERWGFVSGGDWLIPDPGHFEYLRPPRG